MTLEELQGAVLQLPGDELTAFARWFDEYLAGTLDRRIESDINSGALDIAGRCADKDFKSGRCTPL